MSVVQVVLDDKIQEQAEDICERYGIDLVKAIQLFVSRTVVDDDIPFPLPQEILERRNRTDKGIPLDENIFLSREKTDSLIKGIFAYSAWANRTGLSEMTLDEINEEINAAREEREQKDKNKQQSKDYYDNSL